MKYSLIAITFPIRRGPDGDFRNAGSAYRRLSLPRSLSTSILLLSILTSFCPLRAQTEAEAKRLYSEGNARLKSGDNRGALSKFDSALTIRNHEFFHYQRGLALRKLGMEREATASFHAALRMNPHFAAALNALGASCQAIGETDSAIAAYERALAENPRLEPARRGLALALTTKASHSCDAGDTREAIHGAERALSVLPKQAHAHVVLARAYNREGRASEALTAANRALTANQPSLRSAAHFEAGVALRNLGQPVKAREAFVEARKDTAFAVQAETEIQRTK
jgi:tetratricopeptide (TPR) repeat protein